MIGGPFAREAPLELLAKPAPLLLRAWEECDAFISITASENVREGSELSPERQADPPAADGAPATAADGNGGAVGHLRVPDERRSAGVRADAAEYEEFVYGAVLRDWDVEGRRMAGIASLFDGAEEVRIVGERTDLKLSLAGRNGMIEDGHINMPGGEVFYSPIEDSAEGEVTFCEFPAMYYGHEVSGVRLVFEAGQVVEASAATGEDFLLRTLDTDEGARRLGELGIGCNPGIRRFSKNVGFDEKIDGTVHLAIGNSYSSTGGTNISSVHWDMVKDLHNGGQIFVDGRLAQEGGRWLALEPAAG